MAARNPPWNRDELIVALNLYIRHAGNPPGKTSTEITELSDLLNRMGTQQGRQATYRNANGVYMKMMNFRRFDPTYTDTGRAGLQRGGKGEEHVWNNFAHDPDHLRQVATAIRETVESGTVQLDAPDDDDDTTEGEEGRILTRVHRTRERNRAIVDRKKRAVLQKEGALRCEACGFDFEATYGERGRGFIECHHTKPIHTLRPGTKTKLADLALLCSNCHRMIHAARPWLSVRQLRQIMDR